MPTIAVIWRELQDIKARVTKIEMQVLEVPQTQMEEEKESNE